MPFCPCCNNKMNRLGPVPKTTDYFRCVRGHQFQLIGIGKKRVLKVVRSTDTGCPVGKEFPVDDAETFGQEQVEDEEDGEEDDEP